MADAASVLAALQSLTTATELVKAIRSADVSMERAELKLKIAEIAEALADARMAVLDAREEIEKLKQQLAKASAGSRANIVKKNNAYYLKNGDTEEGPFCPRCYEIDGKTMPLSLLPPAFRDLSNYTCPNCKAAF